MSVEYEIKEHIAVIGERQGDVRISIELNKVSWNGREAALELRMWKIGDQFEGGRRAFKGVILSDIEAARLRDVLVTTDLPQPGAGYVQLARATAAVEAAGKVKPK